MRFDPKSSPFGCNSISVQFAANMTTSYSEDGACPKDAFVQDCSPEGLAVDRVTNEDGGIVETHAASQAGQCPGCGVLPRRIDSYYRRAISDLQAPSSSAPSTTLCDQRSAAHAPPVIRFPGDQFGLMIFGHQWKPDFPFMVSRSWAKSTQRLPMMSSSSSIVGICLLTMGSSTRVQSVSAGCNSGE
jgi:hypothetical protein